MELNSQGHAMRKAKALQLKRSSEVGVGRAGSQRGVPRAAAAVVCDRGHVPQPPFPLLSLVYVHGELRKPGLNSTSPLRDAEHPQWPRDVETRGACTRDGV